MWVLDQNAGGSVWTYVSCFFSPRLLVRFLFFVVVRGNPGMQSRGRWSFFFLGNMFIRVEIKDGGRKAKVESGLRGKEMAWYT